MPVRSQAIVRKDIHRLVDLIAAESPAHPVLAAVKPTIEAHVVAVDAAYQTLTGVAVRAARERDERDAAIDRLSRWVRTWRPATLAIVPGAAASLLELPTAKGSADQIVRIAEDLKAFIERDPKAEPLRLPSLTELGTLLDVATKEASEATLALAEEAAAREGVARSTNAANDSLVHTLSIVRTLFGPTSPQYKQFIAIERAEEDTKPEIPVSPTA